jgi:hypothetical protein
MMSKNGSQSVLERISLSRDLSDSSFRAGSHQQMRSSDGDASFSRDDSLISLKGEEEFESGDGSVPIKINREMSFMRGGGHSLDSPRVARTEIRREVWFFAHKVQKKKKQENWQNARVSAWEGSIVDRSARLTFTPGQKRLKKVIDQVSVEEKIGLCLDEKSIVDQSICARRVVEFL